MYSLSGNRLAHVDSVSDEAWPDLHHMGDRQA